MGETKLTERYVDPLKAAKEQAIQQYQKKQLSKIPTELIHLSSQGKYYPEGHPLRDGVVELRYMTAYDEDILTNGSYIREGIVVDKLIESLLITDVDYNTILDCDKDSILIGARSISFGKDYPVKVTSPSGNVIEAVVDLTKLTHKHGDLESNKNGNCIVNINSREYEFKFLNVLQQRTVLADDKPLFRFLVESVVRIDTINTKSKIEEELKYNVLRHEAKELREYILKNTPGLNVTWDFEDVDGGVFTTGFQLRSDFLY